MAGRVRGCRVSAPVSTRPSTRGDPSSLSRDRGEGCLGAAVGCEREYAAILELNDGETKRSNSKTEAKQDYCDVEAYWMSVEGGSGFH